MEKVKQDIIECTIQLFQKQGLQFTTEDILSALSITPDVFGQYFNDQEDLLAQSLEYAFMNIQIEKMKILSSDLSVIDKLKAVMIVIPEEYSTIDYTLFHDLQQRFPKVYEILVESLNADWQPIIELLNEGIISHEIKPINIPLFQTIFTSSIQAFLQGDVLAENQLSYSTALKQLITILIDGIAEEE